MYRRLPFAAQKLHTIDTMKPINFFFSKNVHFTRLVKVAQRLREFNFRMLPGTSNSLLHVDVPDDRGNRIMFKMQKADTGWKIVENGVPQWVSASEDLLNDAIADELK